MRCTWWKGSRQFRRIITSSRRSAGAAWRAIRTIAARTSLTVNARLPITSQLSARRGAHEWDFRGGEISPLLHQERFRNALSSGAFIDLAREIGVGDSFASSQNEIRNGMFDSPGWIALVVGMGAAGNDHRTKSCPSQEVRSMPESFLSQKTRRLPHVVGPYNVHSPSGALPSKPPANVK